MNEPSSSESSPEHNLTDMGKFLNQVSVDRTEAVHRGRSDVNFTVNFF